MIEELKRTQGNCLRPWVAVEDKEEEGVWRHHLTKNVTSDLPWAIDEPNGLRYENCGALELEGLVDVDCKSKRCVFIYFNRK